MPAPASVARPASWRSTTVTRWPSRASSYAHAAPTTPPPTTTIMGRGSGRDGWCERRQVEPEHLRGVAADDRTHLFVGHGGELVRGGVLRRGPRALGVRVVVAPHQRLDAGHRAVVDRDR